MAEQLKQGQQTTEDTERSTAPPAHRDPPATAQNPTDTQPHADKHSPDKAKVGTSDGDDSGG